MVPSVKNHLKQTEDEGVINHFINPPVTSTWLPLVHLEKVGNILPETNMAPENRWLEDDIPFRKAY